MHKCTNARVGEYIELILWLDSHRGSGQGFDLNPGIRVNWVNYVTHTASQICSTAVVASERIGLTVSLTSGQVRTSN